MKLIDHSSPLLLTIWYHRALRINNRRVVLLFGEYFSIAEISNFLVAYNDGVYVSHLKSKWKVSKLSWQEYVDKRYPSSNIGALNDRPNSMRNVVQT